MSKEEINKIQKSIEEILGTESGLSKKRPSVLDKKREHFNIILNGLAHINARSLGLKHDYRVDFIEYDDIFFNVIESLLKLYFNKDQRALINWYLYEKFLPNGDVLILNDSQNGNEIPTETPDDIWELIQRYEKKDIK
tara:strand:- start:499 stop:912 length:414 start_codon:yes stop_codon:yes gene_type:complete